MVNSLVQLIVTNQMRGRVMSVYNFSFPQRHAHGKPDRRMARPNIYGAGGAGRERCCCWCSWGSIIFWSNAASPSFDLIEGRSTMLVLLLAGFLAVRLPSPLETARDLQDRATLEKMVERIFRPPPPRLPMTPRRSIALALACSYLAEVAIEQHDKKAGQQAAERGIKAGEKAVSLKPDSAEYYRVLGTLYGQAIVDIPSGLNYGAKAKEAINQAVEKAPKSSPVYVARGVGNFYLPAMLGGGPKPAIDDFRKAIELDPNERGSVSVAGRQPAQRQPRRRSAQGLREIAGARSPAGVDQAAVGEDAGEVKGRYRTGTRRQRGATAAAHSAAK